MVAAILAGGANTRYPSPKAFIEVDGEPLVRRTLRVLKAAGLGPLVISTNSPELYGEFGIRLVSDIPEALGKGPMGGIISVFEATGETELFIAACDMPFIKQEVVQYIIDNQGGSATVPVMHGRPQPLLAVYKRDVVDEMRARLEHGAYSLTGLVRDIGAVFLDEDALRRMDPEGMSFVNINTPEDRDKLAPDNRGLRP